MHRYKYPTTSEIVKERMKEIKVNDLVSPKLIIKSLIIKTMKKTKYL